MQMGFFEVFLLYSHDFTGIHGSLVNLGYGLSRTV